MSASVKSGILSAKSVSSLIFVPSFICFLTFSKPLFVVLHLVGEAIVRGSNIDPLFE